MKVKVGDNVKILAGKCKGQTGRIVKTLKKDNKVVVEGINIVKKHVKPNRMNEVGSIVEVEAPIHVSNVMIIDPKTNKRTRIGKELDKNGKKVRITKKSNSKLD